MDFTRKNNADAILTTIVGATGITYYFQSPDIKIVTLDSYIFSNQPFSKIQDFLQYTIQYNWVIPKITYPNELKSLKENIRKELPPNANRIIYFTQSLSKKFFTDGKKVMEEMGFRCKDILIPSAREASIVILMEKNEKTFVSTY